MPTRSQARRFLRFALALLLVAALMPSLSRLLRAFEGRPTAMADVCAASAKDLRTGGDSGGVLRAQGDCPACLIIQRGLMPPPAGGERVTQLRIDLGETRHFAPVRLAPGIARRLAPPSRAPPSVA